MPNITEIKLSAISERVLSRKRQLQWIAYFTEGYKANILREAQLGAFTLTTEDLTLLKKMHESSDLFLQRLKVRMK